MSDESRVVPITKPPPLPAGLDVVVGLLCEQLDGIPHQLHQHGLTRAEAAELQAKVDPLVAAFRRHLPPPTTKE